MNVVLDTNILDDHIGKKSASMRAIGTLAREGEVSIHIPYVVEREHRSHMQEKVRAALSQASKAIGNLDAVLPLQDLHMELEALGQKLNRMRKEGAYHPILDDWMKDVGAKVVFPAADHSLEVVDAYFAGARPFKSKKNKHDFPDALIWVLVKQVASNAPVSFITNDKGFTGADLGDLPIKLYSSLESFLQTPEMQSHLATAQETENVERLRGQHKRSRKLILNRVLGKINDYLSQLTTITTGSFQDSAQISDINDVEDIDIEMKYLEYYGEGVLVVPVAFQVELGYETDVPLDEFMEAVEAGEASLSSEDFEDDNIFGRYFEITRHRTFTFNGNIRLDFGQNLTQALDEGILFSALENADMTLEDIEQD